MRKNSTVKPGLRLFPVTVLGLFLLFMMLAGCDGPDVRYVTTSAYSPPLYRGYYGYSHPPYYYDDDDHHHHRPPHRPGKPPGQRPPDGPVTIQPVPKPRPPANIGRPRPRPRPAMRRRAR